MPTYNISVMEYRKVSSKRKSSTSDTAPLLKKPCPDDAFAATLLQYQLDFPTTAETERNVESFNNKMRADQLEIQNAKQSPLLKLAPELLELICEHVFHDQVLRVTAVDGRARLVHSTNADTFALPCVCRKLRQDLAEYPYTRSTIQIATFRFISLISDWHTAIRDNHKGFNQFLRSIPGKPKRFEVVGVNGGITKQRKRLDLGKVRGYVDFDHARREIDSMAALEKLIRMVYPKAKIAFREVKNMEKL